jgi:hypothetical protein
MPTQTPHTRRQFLQAAGGAALGLEGLPFLAGLPAVSAADARPGPKLVRLDAGIEPLVRLLEETPRDRLLEEVAGRIRRGLAYRDVVAALLLAGVRNVQPRPTVGFKFHAVLVVHSAHLASLAAADGDRWLPLFWALDYFKVAQDQNTKEGGWRLGPVDEARVPPARKAAPTLAEALDKWDEPAADAAAAGVARSVGSDAAFELFVRYGARDFRDIGHKAIYVANAFRTLQTIGWQHAEPVLRSLAYALLRHEGDSPAGRDDPADRPGRRNQERAGQFAAGWAEGKPDPAATTDLLAALRQGTADDAAGAVAGLLAHGAGPQSAWDAVHLGAGELLARQPGIVALHAVTSANALRYAFTASGDDATRRWLLLQAAAFVALFREAAKGRGALADVRLDKLEPTAPAGTGADAVAEIFADVGRDRPRAARKLLGYLRAGGDPRPLHEAARRLVFRKGTNSHDYKYSSALLEDAALVSPAWRDRYLATGAFNLRGSTDPDTALVDRTRAALGG